jgi:GNAT superfamily N-acetyltransferase
MQVKHLGNTDFNIIMECFLLAFENYFVPMPTDYNFYKQRWEAAGVRYDLSYGMFNEGKLVGFIINAIDKRQGYVTAYNSGTGVIPEYRGRRIVKSIYEYAIPELIKNGITKCQLEVITENQKAIKSYEGIGFKICKHFKCYKGRLLTQRETNYSLSQVSHRDFNWVEFLNQDLYSWDNQKESVIKGDFKYYLVKVDGTLQSYFIINPKSGYIAQFEVLDNTVLHWQNLFSAIQSIIPEVKINNVDERLTYKINEVEKLGLKNIVNQFEMELFLKV